MDFSSHFNDVTNRQIQKRKIPLSELVENDKNVYRIVNIDNLATDIAETGLLQPIIVKPNDNGKYVIISGHRRFNAYKKLKESDPAKFNDIDCIIVDANEDENVTTHKLHSSNLNVRKITKYEYLKIYQDYLQMFESGIISFQGRTRANIAELMNVSENLINDISHVLKHASVDEIEACRFDDENNEQFNLLLKRIRARTKKPSSTNATNNKYDKKYLNKHVSALLDYANYHNNQEMISLLEQLEELN